MELKRIVDQIRFDFRIVGDCRCGKSNDESQIMVMISFDQVVFILNLCFCCGVDSTSFKAGFVPTARRSMIGDFYGICVSFFGGRSS